MCHGFCIDVKHHKVIKWIPRKIRSFFKFCKKCHLYIKHRMEEFNCVCCGTSLRIIPSVKKTLAKYYQNKRQKKRIDKKKWRENNKKAISEYNREYYKNNKAIKQENYEKVIKKKRLYPENKQKHNEDARKSRLRNRLYKIFFILADLFPQWNIPISKIC